MSVLQVESLWNYIQTLALSNRNKQWLAEHLVESTKPTADSAQKETDYILSSSAMRDIINDGDKQVITGQGTAIKVDDLWK